MAAPLAGKHQSASQEAPEGSSRLLPTDEALEEEVRDIHASGLSDPGNILLAYDPRGFLQRMLGNRLFRSVLLGAGVLLLLVGVLGLLISLDTVWEPGIMAVSICLALAGTILVGTSVRALGSTERHLIIATIVLAVFMTLLCVGMGFLVLIVLGFGGII